MRNMRSRHPHAVRSGFILVVLPALFAAGHLAFPATPAPPPPDDLCVVARVGPEATPPEAFPGLRSDQARAIPKDARCSVCGMYPARSLRFAAQLIYHDGATRFFDSPIDLVRFLRERRRFDPDRHNQPVAAQFVTEFEGGRWLAFDDAIFVRNSDVSGPMRTDGAPAFADVSAARHFRDRHGGTIVIGGAALMSTLDEASNPVGKGLAHSH